LSLARGRRFGLLMNVVAFVSLLNASVRYTVIHL
jgi:hypothetical protein